jgi:hypothetical protein
MHLPATQVRVRTVVVLSFLSIVLAIANAWLSGWSMEPGKLKERMYCKQTNKFSQIKSPDIFSAYLGDDYPEFYIPTLGDLAQVTMTMEESRHYAVVGPDAHDEWASNSPVGYGYIRLGPEYRGFSIAMFHELHCLHVIRLVLAGSNKTHTLGHMQHCLNYLRQFILCSPSLVLEPADSLTRDFETDRVGATHVCLDWSQMYTETEDNWWKWEPMRNSNGTSPTAGPT